MPFSHPSLALSVFFLSFFLKIPVCRTRHEFLKPKPLSSELREEVETRRSEAAGLRKEISQLRRGSVTVWRQGSFEGV